MLEPGVAAAAVAVAAATSAASVSISNSEKSLYSLLFGVKKFMDGSIKPKVRR